MFWGFLLWPFRIDRTRFGDILTFNPVPNSVIAVELRGVHIILYDAVCVSIHGACSTAQGLHAVLQGIGIMQYLCFWLILLPIQNSDHIT